MTQIRVVKKIPGLGIIISWIDNDLAEFQKYVDGYIETVPLAGTPGILLIVNEEGKLRGMQPNIINGGDVLVGPVMAVRAGSEDFISLTDDDIPTVCEALSAADVSAQKYTDEPERDESDAVFASVPDVPAEA